MYSQLDIDRIEHVQDLVRKGWTLSAAARRATEPSPSHVADQGDVEEVDGHEMELFIAGHRQIDHFATVVAYETTRRLMRAVDASDVRELVSSTVSELGGRLVASCADANEALAIDISLGEELHQVVCASPGSLARRRLEAVLPLVVDDARALLARMGAVTSRPPRKP